MERADSAQPRVLGTAEYESVVAVADALSDHLSSAEVAAAIRAANQPGLSSAGVRAVFLEHARALGFMDESKGLFAGQLNRALRPDYFLRLGHTGVLIEVERGKTTINNMDLLDFWKCHICEHAHYLILLVPIELRQNPTMSPRREFVTVRNRLSSFFEEATTPTSAASSCSATELLASNDRAVRSGANRREGVLMVSSALKAQFDEARSRYDDARSELEHLVIQMVIENLADVLPGTTAIRAFGDVDEDWIPRLRAQQVCGADGSVLFDVTVGHSDRSVEDAIDYVNTELLDVLIDLRPDAYSGDVEIGR